MSWTLGMHNRAYVLYVNAQFTYLHEPSDKAMSTVAALSELEPDGQLPAGEHPRHHVLLEVLVWAQHLIQLLVEGGDVQNIHLVVLEHHLSRHVVSHLGQQLQLRRVIVRSQNKLG